MTIGDIQKEHNLYREAWISSSSCADLRNQVLSVEDHVPIRKIVCFGLGGFSARDKEFRARSHVQTAAIKTIASALTKHPEANDYDIPCYSQDPDYTDPDIELLKRLGVIPLQDPRGFIEVDENTLVYTVAPDVPVRQIVADLQWPAALICNTIRAKEEDPPVKSMPMTVEDGGELVQIM
jgi:hypothetical protein